MKKVFWFTVALMMVIMTAITAVGEEVMGNVLDYVWLELIKEEFAEAIDSGEELDYGAYLYDGAIYLVDSDSPNSYLDASGNGFDEELSRGNITHLEKYLTNRMEEAGMKFPKVEINFAGEYEGEPLYSVTIAAMQNLNEVENDKVGNGFIADGINYNMLRVICRIK